MSSIIALPLSIVFKCMKQSIGSNLKVLNVLYRYKKKQTILE